VLLIYYKLKQLWNGSKKACIKVGEHFAENNVWAKGAIAKREERLRKHGALAKRHEVQQQSADRFSRRCQRRWEITIIELSELKTMQITIDLPDNLALTESDLRREVAIALFQQNILLIEQAAQVIAMDVDDFYQILVDRGILTPPSDPDDDPNELILAHLRISLQQAKKGNLKPVSELWDGIDD
jgi:predicted HTH domain antitoxin